MQSKLVERVLDKQNKNHTTENGMRTRSSSNNHCLDLFFMAGASRGKTENEIISMFMKAYNEDSTTALMLLAHIRDCRGGMGERRFFRVCIKYLAEHGKTFDVSSIPSFGRWDDIFSLFKTSMEREALSAISNGFAHKDKLLAKWLPRKGEIAAKVAHLFGRNMRNYRKLIVEFTDVVETKMCNKEWAGINYQHVPSVANVKYNKAFLRNDEDRRREFLGKAAKGEVKINAAVSFPHDIIKMMLTSTGTMNVKEGSTLANIVTKNDTAIAMWKNLPDYLKGSLVRMLPICDTSGSMNGLPFLISLALGLYISERNKGLFNDAFITFSGTPRLHYCKGNLFEKLCGIKAHHPSNTNLEASFNLILRTAIDNKLKQSEMPTHLLIISDMEFDQATRSNASALAMIKQKYREAGYDMPAIVFWNVNSRQDNIPVKFNKDNVALISGASPSAIKAVLSGNINPMDVLYRAIDKPIYKQFAQQSGRSSNW
jgi:hypothetical protein